VEVPHGRRRERRQPRDHAQQLNRRLHAAHRELRAVFGQPLALARFLIGSNERSDRHMMLLRQMLDHVERSYLASALRRKREAMADVENLHAAATLSSSATSPGVRPSR